MNTKELIDYYKKLTDYIKNLETKKSDIENKLNEEKQKLITDSLENNGIYNVDEEKNADGKETIEDEK